jgi:hypothetical protein
MSRRLQSTPHDYERLASLSLSIFHRTLDRSEFAQISSFDLQTFSFSSTPDFDLRLLPPPTTRLHVSGRLGPRNPDDLASAFPISALKQSTYSGKRLRSREPFRSLAKCDFRTTRQVRVARLQKDSSALCQRDAPGSSRKHVRSSVDTRSNRWHSPGAGAAQLNGRLGAGSFAARHK